MESYCSKKDLFCPITICYFSNPVLAEDGHFYEKEAILEWFERKSTSPMTGEKISKKITPSFFVKNLVNDFLEKNPKEKTKVYASQEEIVQKVKKGIAKPC